MKSNFMIFLPREQKNGFLIQTPVSYLRSWSVLHY